MRIHLSYMMHKEFSSLSNEEIFKNLAHMGYVTNSESLTFFKGHFSPQWKFFIHTILHCLSSKQTAWDQFSSNIATALVCLATSMRITSLPSLSPQPQPSLSPELIQPTYEAEETDSMPHDSPLHDVHSHGSAEGSVHQHDLTVLVTKLNDRIDGLVKDLQQTNKTYSTALTKLVLRVKKLEYKLKSGKARRKAKIYYF
ncbi:hypothetical protein Tco_0179299 [Tanacetum coccineum]